LGTTLASPLLAAVVERLERLPLVKRHPKDLDLKMARVFAFLKDDGGTDPERKGKVFDASIRQRADAVIARAQGLFLRVDGVEKQDLEIPTDHGIVRARLYRPKAHTTPLRIVHYCHGGGFLFCNLETHDVLCQALARRADALVVSVDYRLAPEHPFPAASDDAYASYRWLIANGATLGGDPKRIAVAGDSAGGNLAATTAIRASRDGIQPPTMQLLIYPFLDLAAQDTESHRLYGNGDYWITTHGVGHARGQYIGASLDPHDPLISPLRLPDVSSLPPAFVVTAACDPLRDEGEAWVAKLQAAGVPARGTRYLGMGHGFVSMLGIIPDAVVALEECAEALRKT
jgi:acetyl esterase